MDEMKVYIVNLGKYVEGEDAGAWFTLPVDKEMVAERLGLGGVYGEVAIHDYELPFQIGEFGSVDGVAEAAENLTYYDGCSVEDVARELIKDSGVLDALPEHLQDYFDYEAYARDLKINGDLIECSRGVFMR